MSYVLYSSQLQERRRYRSHCLRSLSFPPSSTRGLVQSGAGRVPAASRLGLWSAPGQGERPADCAALPQLDIVPVWKLYLPQAAVLLALAFAAGRGVDVLYMI